MAFLTEDINFRLRPIEAAELRLVVEKNPLIFENISHFVRVAVIRHLREWKDYHTKTGSLAKPAQEEVYTE